jgi:hypothetical protein
MIGLMGFDDKAWFSGFWKFSKDLQLNFLKETYGAYVTDF